MDNVLDYIERYKFAIIGTTIIHVAFFFYANFTTVEKPYKFVEPVAEITIPIEDIMLDPEMMEQMNLNNQPSEEVYNMAADANDNREKSYDDYSTQDMEHFDETSAKDLEKQYFEEWAATHPDSDNNSNSSNNNKSDNNKSDNNHVDKSIKTGGSNAFAGEVMVSYNLTNRKAHSLPKPGYKCNSSGTVVIDVKVDKSGDVKSAVFNSGASRGADECMVNQAMTYAKKSRFNFSSSSGSSQSGTITYKFVSK